MKRLLLTFCLLLLCAGGTQADVYLQSQTVCTGTDVSVTTTAETVVGTAVITAPSATNFRVRARMYGVMTTSADSTSYKLRVRRATVSGTAIGDALAEAVKVTAGGIEAFYFEFTDERSGSFATLTYVSTIEMAGASATTTVGQNCLVLDIFS
jgi:hypothetical protein